MRFADVDAGRALLMADDEWMRATSEFQRRAVMGSATPVTLDAFRRWNGASVTPWSDELRARDVDGARVVARGRAPCARVVPGASGAPSRAAQRQDGQPLWHPLDGPHEYLRRLGGNTGYVIHHEEAMADNVALLATGQRARNPELLARIKAALEAPR